MNIHLFNEIETYELPNIPNDPFWIAGYLYKTNGAIMVRIPADNGEFIANAPPVQDYSFDPKDYEAQGILLPDPGPLEVLPCDCINEEYRQTRQIEDLGEPYKFCDECDGTGQLGYEHKPISIGNGLWLAWKYISYLRQHLITHVHPAKYKNKTGPVYYFAGDGF